MVTNCRQLPFIYTIIPDITSKQIKSKMTVKKYRLPCKLQITKYNGFNAVKIMYNNRFNNTQKQFL